MTFYIDLGAEAEERLRMHAKRLGQSIDSIANDAIERLVKRWEDSLADVRVKPEDRNEFGAADRQGSARDR